MRSGPISLAASGAGPNRLLMKLEAILAGILTGKGDGGSEILSPLQSREDRRTCGTRMGIARGMEARSWPEALSPALRPMGIEAGGTVRAGSTARLSVALIDRRQHELQHSHCVFELHKL